MISLLFFLSLYAVFFIWVYFLYLKRGLFTAIIFPALVLSAVRVSLVLIGTYLVQKNSGSDQILGYLMLLFSFPESLFIQTLSDDPTLWSVILSLLVAAGSFMMTFLFAGISALVAPKSPKSNS